MDVSVGESPFQTETFAEEIMMFSDVLLTVDFDRTLTARDGTIPRRNLDAITYFIENGGVFTVNTGRSYISFRPFLQTVPINGDLLLLNGSAAWKQGRFSQVKNIELDVWDTLQRLVEKYPYVNLELQAPDMHYLIDPTESYATYYSHRNLPHRILPLKRQPLEFVKIGIYGDVHGGLGVDEMDEKANFDEISEFLAAEFGDQLEIFRATPRIINVHAKGVSKLAAARELQKKLGRKILVCVGDEGNDVAMLQGADYGFCPSDGQVADRFPNVCPCGQGAIADVILEKIPEILKIKT